jgi:polyisoprenyl-teichoic acid--peptidoglycan teichoic acid transferase
MLQVLKLFLASRNSAIKEVHFPGNLGGDYVTAAPAAIHTAVRQFLGIEGSNGPRGSAADLPSQGGQEKPPAGKGGGKKGGGKKAPKGKKKKAKPAKPAKAGANGLFDASDSGKEQAFFAKRKLSFPVYYPTQLRQGTVYAQDPHVYAILHATGNRKYQAYKMVMKTGLGEYYGIMGTTWPNPPILRSPSETRNIKGRTFLLYYDNDRLRMVAWKTPTGTYWLSNTLLQDLSEQEMLGIAASTAATKVSRAAKRKAAAKGGGVQ